MDQANLQNLLDFTQPAFTGPYNLLTPNPQFVNAFATIIPVFLCPSDPADPQITETGLGFVYAGVNYMVSNGSGTGLNYDERWPTDGIVYENSNVGFNKITDGASNTVFLAETVRSNGADTTLPAGILPPFPYQYTLNGSTGLNSALQPTPGIPVTGAPWTGGPNGMNFNPNLATVWPSLTGWRGAGSTALRGRGDCWASAGVCSSMTNGYTTPNSTIPDIVTHFTGFFAPRSWHTGGANVLMGDGAVRFLTNSINANTQHALFSRNGADIPGDY
jgi:prepilin-type processing-associated H-X9-DG protein